MPLKPRWDVKRNLWPWRDCMTIGVGVLATSDDGRLAKRVPDIAILLADTMGSYEDIDSHARLHKTLMFPEDRIYAVAAGDVTKAAQLVPGICTFLREIPKGERFFGRIQTAIANGHFEFKHHLFMLNELPKLRIAPHAFDPNQKLEPELNEKIQAAWANYEIGCDLIIAAFDDNGTAYLFEANGHDHIIHTRNFPGFAAIGSGADNAMTWLARRAHTLGMLPLRSAYHAYEAKIAAEASGHVNKHLDMLVMTADDYWFSTTHRSLHGLKDHPEINLANLRRLLKKHCLKKTDPIGTIKQSDSRKSAKGEKLR